MRSGFDIEPKPLDTIPYKSAKEQVEEAIKNLHGVGFEVPAHTVKLKVDDYYNIIKAYLSNKALQTLGFEPKTNWTVLFIIALIITALITIISIWGK
jgi:ribosome maturation protein Sdo1